MTQISKLQRLHISGFWGKEVDDQASVIIYSTDRIAGMKLRNLLFAWHQSSWYGTEITISQVGEQAYFHLTAVQALDFLSDVRAISMVDIVWSEQMETLIQMAKLLREILVEGWFEPSWSKFRQQQIGFDVTFPEQHTSKKQQWQQLLLAAEQHGNGAVSHWIDVVLQQLIRENEAVHRAYTHVVSNTSDMKLSEVYTDEQDWKIAIGLEQDTTPFRLALHLLEPDRDEGRTEWQVVPSIQPLDETLWYPLHYDAETKEWFFFYDELQWNNEQLPEQWQSFITERVEKEEQKWSALLSDWSSKYNEQQKSGTLNEIEVWHFLHEESIRLVEAGCSVVLPAWWNEVQKQKMELQGKVKDQYGTIAEPLVGLSQIVQFDWQLAIGNVQLTEEQFLQLAAQKRRLVQIGGQWIHLDPNQMEQVRDWLKKVGKRKQYTFRDMLEIHLHANDSFQLEEEHQTIAIELEMNEHLQQIMNQLKNIATLPIPEVSTMLQGELRPYQQQGMAWLLFLRKYGLGAVLADDMGLGKTIQFIAYLTHIKQAKTMGTVSEVSRYPSLLICPTSVIGNWERELAHFAPNLNVIVHYGNKRIKDESFYRSVADADLVITSYSLALLDHEQLQTIQWDALCLDEAQNIKNTYAKGTVAIKKIMAHHRIAMTGTPMENRLTELWSIYDFINPGYLGSFTKFRNLVVNPIEKTRDTQLITNLQRWVQPFMLRRVKKDPAIQLALPDKVESKVFITLTEEQAAIYESIVNDMLHKIETLDPMKRRGLVLSSLSRLKQLCSHPSLYLKDQSKQMWQEKRSNKMMRLLEMVDEVAAKGERCLIFTQYVEMGEQLQKILQRRLKLDVPYLYGGVAKEKRDEMIAQFQDQSSTCCAFVLSLKAGGTGLNLTAANHVFHFDRWWNPAVENQATDRAYRIGQSKDVQVHKLIALGTLEEKIDAMIDSKQLLNDQVVSQSELWLTELSTEQLQDVFMLRQSWLKG
ncbi:DEAD/DEAH box helicase [Paenibacillus yanchengensis]|uniref:DEAD/DEAH box helicase n=1 Tax=Paenibacillus yanchengensis TaxID=2035833 RepID=A0ABW4YQQ5_9BACL